MQLLALQWRHNGRDGVSNHQPHDCLLIRLFGCKSKKTSKLRVTGLCEGNSPVTGEFPAQRVSNTEKVSIWWRHHGALVKRTLVANCSTHSFFIISFDAQFLSRSTHWVHFSNDLLKCILWNENYCILFKISILTEIPLKCVPKCLIEMKSSSCHGLVPNKG